MSYKTLVIGIMFLIGSCTLAVAMGVMHGIVWLWIAGVAIQTIILGFFIILIIKED